MTLIGTLFYLNAAFASEALLNDGSLEPIANNTTFQQIESQQSASVDDVGKRPDDVKSLEEILVESDPLLKTLKGRLHRAFEAFDNGDFAKAERQFTKLAIREYRQVRDQEFLQQGSVRLLNLPQSRLSFSTEDVGSKEYTPVSAPNARLRSFGYQLPVANLKKASSILFYLKGVAEARQDKEDEARKSYRKALSLDKYHVEPRIELALILLKEGNLETASKQIARLDKFAEVTCDEQPCTFSPESRDRYSQIRLAYQNMVNEKS